MKEKSFEYEQSLISAMKQVLYEEPIYDDTDMIATFRDTISRLLCDNKKQAFKILEYIEAGCRWDDLCTFITFYINYVDNRSSPVVVRIIKDCLNSSDYSVQSVGIDMIALHSSFPKVKPFLDFKFNHPYLQKKIEQLRQEVKEINNEN